MTNEEIDRLVEKIRLQAKDMADLEVSAHMGYYSVDEVQDEWKDFVMIVENYIQDAISAAAYPDSGTGKITKE